MTEYCPKCRSRLYPVDKEYMEKYGKCSYCVTVERFASPSLVREKKGKKQIIHFLNKEV